MGAGLGFAYLPVSGIVSKHFKKRRALAMGIITTGGSIGGFVLSLLGNKLLYSDLGFPWTVRVSAFIVLGSCVIANLLLSDIHPGEPAVVTQNPEKSMAEATDGIATAERSKVSPNKEDNKATLSDPEGCGESVELSHKPRTIKQMLQDPAYLAIISMGFVVSLGLYFPMSATQQYYPIFV
jgi:MFS family permease